jgi:hypothetical protein
MSIKKTISAIVADLADQPGIGTYWSAMSREDQEEIEERWRKIIEENLYPNSENDLGRIADALEKLSFPEPLMTCPDCGGTFPHSTAYPSHRQPCMHCATKAYTEAARVRRLSDSIKDPVEMVNITCPPHKMRKTCYSLDEPDAGGRTEVAGSYCENDGCWLNEKELKYRLTGEGNSQYLPYSALRNLCIKKVHRIRPESLRCIDCGLYPNRREEKMEAYYKEWPEFIVLPDIVKRFSDLYYDLINLVYSHIEEKTEWKRPGEDMLITEKSFTRWPPGAEE